MKKLTMERTSPRDQGHANAALESYRRWNELTPVEQQIRLLGTDGKSAPRGLALMLRQLRLQEMTLR